MINLTTEYCALILFVATILTHGLLLVNDGLYWDGWLLNGWQITKDWPSMQRFFREVGMPLLFIEHRIMAFLPGRIFAYKILGFISLYISAFSVYLLAVQFGSLTPFEALCLSLLMLCYPGQQMLVEPVVSLNYMLPVALFFSACWLGLSAELILDSNHWLYHFGALILFTLSFNMNSLLLYYGGYLLFLLSFQLFSHGIGLYGTVWFIASHIDFLVLPIMFWWLKEKVTPRQGYYATYNRLVITRQKTVDGFRQLLKQGLSGTLVDALKFILGRSIGWILCGITCVFLLLCTRDLAPMPALKAFLVIDFGAIILIAAGLPYIWVGQPFTLRGWGTKNNLLLALPSALLIVGSSHLILNAKSIVVFWTVVLVASVVYLNYIYLCWLAVWAKNRSFLYNMSQIPAAKELSIIGVCDQHPVRGSFDDGHPEHAAVYLTYMFTYIWGHVRQLGMYESSPRFLPYLPAEISATISASSIDYALSDINKNGLQGMFVIKPGKLTLSEVQTAWRYLKFRFFNQSRFDKFLSEITQVEFYPLHDQTGTTASIQAPLDSLIEKAKINMDNGQWEEALSYLYEATAIRPEREDLYAGIGYCLINLNRSTESVPYFRRTAELHPDPENFLLLGIACEMSGQMSEAETAYRQVLSINPGDLEAGRNLGGVYLAQGRYDEGMQTLAGVLAFHPSDVPTLLLLADSCLHIGDPERAHEFYSKVLICDANNIQAINALARL